MDEVSLDKINLSPAQFDAPCDFCVSLVFLPCRALPAADAFPPPPPTCRFGQFNALAEMPPRIAIHFPLPHYTAMLVLLLNPIKISVQPIW